MESTGCQAIWDDTGQPYSRVRLDRTDAKNCDQLRRSAVLIVRPSNRNRPFFRSDPFKIQLNENPAPR